MFRFLFNVLILSTGLVFYSFSWAAEAHWIDVRTVDEYNAGHVAGAVNIPYTEIIGRIGEVTRDQDAAIYVYCRSGRRSGIAQVMLKEAGFTNVVNQGGLEEAKKTASEMAAR